MASKELPKQFEQIHKILGKAMRAVDESLWPPRPHFGGPLPVLSTHTQLAIAVELCEHVRDIAEAGERAEYNKRLALARQICDGKTIPKKDIDSISSTAKSDSRAIRVAKQTLRTAYNHLYAASSARNVVGQCAENAAISAVTYYAEQSDDDARAFLRWLDGAVLRCELRAVLKERNIDTSAAVADIVSRPKGPTKTLALVMAKLADGNYGLLVKLKQRWQWHEGDRDTVFATVPDEFMRVVMADIDPGFKRTQA